MLEPEVCKKRAARKSRHRFFERALCALNKRFLGRSFYIYDGNSCTNMSKKTQYRIRKIVGYYNLEEGDCKLCSNQILNHWSTYIASLERIIYQVTWNRGCIYPLVLRLHFYSVIFFPKKHLFTFAVFPRWKCFMDPTTVLVDPCCIFLGGEGSMRL